jgi:hypothetical protein
MNPANELKIRRVLSMILEGKSQKDSYLEVYKCKESSAPGGVAALMQKPEVKELMSLMAEQAESKLTMSRVGKREWLRRLKEVKITEIDLECPDKTDHDLIETVTYRYDRHGEKVSATIKLPSKLQALEMDNRMAGHNEAEKVEVALTGGVMVVSAPLGLDDFEKQAEAQQRKLKQVDYIDLEEDESLC